MASTPLPKDDVQNAPLEDLTFQPSPDTTLGVELELQILDRESSESAPGAVRILEGCEDAEIAGVSGEFLLSMLEVKTGICRNVCEVRDSLVPLLRQVRNIASSLGYDLAVGGTHPFGRPSMSAIFPDERYQRIQKQQGWLAYQEGIYGLHIHVGVPSAEAAIGVTNLLVEYLPHMNALSANSPFWQGIDTGYSSARLSMFRPSAHAGLPRYFARWQDFCDYCEVMHGCGAIRGTKDIHWDIRPRPHLGTVEFRIFDAPASLATLLALTAFTRCLVIDALHQLQQRPKLGKGDVRHYWLALENRWLASRYGLRAQCMRRPEGERLSLADDTARLLDRLLPVAREFEEVAFLAPFLPVEAIESGADRQRRVFRQAGKWQAIVEDLQKRWDHEIEEAFAAPDNRAPQLAAAVS